MSKKTSDEKRKAQPDAKAQKAKDEKPKKPIPQPVNRVDGVPDCAVPRSRRRLAIIVGIFALWIAFLIYCLLAAPAAVTG